MSSQELLQTLPRSRPFISSFGAQFVDVTGDGHKDLVVNNRYYSPGVFAGDGRGAFRPEPQQNVPRIVLLDVPRFVAFDADRDGDQDLFVVNGGAGILPPTDLQDRLWLNDGRGVFVDATSTHLPRESHRGWGVSVADFDQDGDPDIAVASGVRDGFLFYVNDGSGHFTEEAALRMPNSAAFVYALAAADVDGDADLDLIAATFGDPSGVIGDFVRLYLNDGRGVFSDHSHQMPATTTRTRDLAIADVDGDRDVDLVLGCCPPNPTSLHQNKIFVNDGTGHFTDESFQRFVNQPPRSLTGSVAFFDVDADGDMDLFEGGLGDTLQYPANRLWLNDGRGSFHDVTGTLLPFLGGATTAGGVLAADLDGDGDEDVHVGPSFGGDLVYWNLRNHLYPPAAPATGSPYAVDLHGPPGGFSLSVVGAPGAALPIPGLGTWWIDPAVAVPLNPVALSSSGRGNFAIPVPANPGLVGWTFRLQSLNVDVSGPRNHGFTAAWTERIDR